MRIDELKTKRTLLHILYLGICFIVYVFSNGQWSVSLFTWIYPILFLFLINFHSLPKTCLMIFGICTIGYIIQFSSVIGMSIWICILVGILVSVIKVLPYLVYFKSKKSFASTITFACTMVVVEYIIYLIYPMLGGLSDAYTQYQNLFLIQITTLLGIYGITFIINWTAATVVWLWHNRNEIFIVKKPLYIIYFAVIGCVLIYNSLMLFLPINTANSVRTASVTVPVSHLLNEDTDVSAVFYSNSFTDENLSEAKRKLSDVHNELWDKTLQEIAAGAKVVFWSELNGAVMKEDEQALIKKAADIAESQHIYLIISLLVKTPYEELKENKTVAFNPKGEIVSEYYKHGRSIGELCIKGDGEIKSFETEFGRISPFICSDMAFTSTIRQAGKNDVDILLIPASDWKEMSPIAIKTAVIRGVENGCSVIRQTNKGLSISSDNRGNVLSMTDYFTSNTKVMVSEVPTDGRRTIYPYIGNLFVYLCGIYLLALSVIAKIAKQK